MYVNIDLSIRYRAMYCNTLQIYGLVAQKLLRVRRFSIFHDPLQAYVVDRKTHLHPRCARNFVRLNFQKFSDSQKQNYTNQRTLKTPTHWEILQFVYRHNNSQRNRVNRTGRFLNRGDFQPRPERGVIAIKIMCRGTRLTVRYYERTVQFPRGYVHLQFISRCTRASRTRMRLLLLQPDRKRSG